MRENAISRQMANFIIYWRRRGFDVQPVLLEDNFSIRSALWNGLPIGVTAADFVAADTAIGGTVLRKTQKSEGT